MTILVCIDGTAKSKSLLHAARLKANVHGCGWIALHINTSHGETTNADSETLTSLFATAEQMGAECVSINANNVFSGITDFLYNGSLHNQNIIQIIVGQTPKSGFLKELRLTIGERLIRELRNSTTEIRIVPLTADYYTPSWYDRLKLRKLHIHDMGIVVLSSIIALGCARTIQHYGYYFNSGSISYPLLSFFLLATIFSSLRCGFLSGVISLLINSFIVNFIFTVPYGSLFIEAPQQRIGMALFIFTGLIGVLFGAYNRASNRALIRREENALAFYSLHRATSNVSNIPKALKTLHEELDRLLDMDVAFFLPEDNHPEHLAPAYPYDFTLSEEDAERLNKHWDLARAEGVAKSAADKHSGWRFEIMHGMSVGDIGVLGINTKTYKAIDISSARLLRALADQCAATLERIQLAEEAQRLRIQKERENLRAMLLSSVSHDLKTPLASVIGSLSVFQRMQQSGKLNQDIGKELIETAYNEANRLDGFITNILDMTRIESGDIEFDIDWSSPAQMIDKVTRRMQHRLNERRLVLDIPDKPIEVRADSMLTEQVYQNILDNAVKYSPVNTEIIVSLKYDKTNCHICVRDHGYGIPEEKLGRIFDKYERLKQTDSTVAGTGLGLAIAKAIMEGQNGSIKALSHDDGSEFIISFSEWRLNDEADMMKETG